MYNDNYLIYDDVMELEEAGLDVDELAEMDEEDRYDAIDEAGLNPLDYEYGFLDDDCGSTAGVSGAVNRPAQSQPVSSSDAPQMRVKKMSKREIKKMQKAHDELETTLDALLGMRL